MTLSIEYPPTTRACARCTSPIAWLYSARTGKWVAFATEPTDIHLLRVHDCPQYPDDRPPPAWRDLTEIDEDTKRSGIALVRAAIASKEAGGMEPNDGK